MQESSSEYEKEKMQERMARLASGVAVLKVTKHVSFKLITFFYLPGKGEWRGDVI